MVFRSVVPLCGHYYRKRNNLLTLARKVDSNIVSKRCIGRDRGVLWVGLEYLFDEAHRYYRDCELAKFTSATLPEQYRSTSVLSCILWRDEYCCLCLYGSENCSQVAGVNR